MINKLLNKFRSTIYVQIWENRIRVVDYNNNHCFDEQPLVAIEVYKKGKNKVLAVGNNVKSPSFKNCLIMNPFSHPRCLLLDFEVAEKLIQKVIKSFYKNQFYFLPPFIIIHPMEKLDGGLTQVEKRAFKELGYGAGGIDVVVYEGETLLRKDINYYQQT